MAKAVRMADIAQKLGISIVSVSKGLSGKDGVSDEMRARILETAQEMGYIPPASSAPKTEGGENIGIIVADRFFNDNTFYSKLYREVLTFSARQGFFVLMELVEPAAEYACSLPAFLSSRKVDGVIFMGEISRDYLRAAIATGIPYMLLDIYDYNLDANSVLSDNVDGGYTLCKHLLDTGRTKIGFVGSITETTSIMDRYLGYCKALYLAGITPRPDWRLEDRDKEGMYVPFILPKEMPEAFICSTDEVAYRLVEFLQNEGYRVPEDVAVAGYDDFRYSMMCRPQLTTYRVDIQTMAETAVSSLRHKMNGKRAVIPRAIVPGTFVRREST